MTLSEQNEKQFPFESMKDWLVFTLLIFIIETLCSKHSGKWESSALLILLAVEMEGFDRF